MDIITVLLCPPGQKPQLIQISNTVQEIEGLLGGTLGIKELDDGIFLLFNDLGHQKALDLNRVIQDDPIFGSCIFCRKEGYKFTSLNYEEIKELENLLV